MGNKGTPAQADNAENNFKCPQCGNMYPVKTKRTKCDVCGHDLSLDNKILGASNEGY